MEQATLVRRGVVLRAGVVAKNGTRRQYMVMWTGCHICCLCEHFHNIHAAAPL
jgi:hypothetical protein